MNNSTEMMTQNQPDLFIFIIPRSRRATDWADVWTIWSEMHNSVTSSLELSLAEFKDEQTWPDLQLVVYKKF